MEVCMSEEMIRVNFDLKREDYAVFKDTVKRSGLDVSKCLRALIKEFVRKEQRDTFATSVVNEDASKISNIEPELDPVPGE